MINLSYVKRQLFITKNFYHKIKHDIQIIMGRHILIYFLLKNNLYCNETVRTLDFFELIEMT